MNVCFSDPETLPNTFSWWIFPLRLGGGYRVFTSNASIEPILLILTLSGDSSVRSLGCARLGRSHSGPTDLAPAAYSVDHFAVDHSASVAFYASILRRAKDASPSSV